MSDRAHAAATKAFLASGGWKTVQEGRESDSGFDEAVDVIAAAMRGYAASSVVTPDLPLDYRAHLSAETRTQHEALDEYYAEQEKKGQDVAYEFVGSLTVLTLSTGAKVGCGWADDKSSMMLRFTNDQGTVLKFGLSPEAVSVLKYLLAMDDSGIDTASIMLRLMVDASAKTKEAVVDEVKAT